MPRRRPGPQASHSVHSSFFDDMSGFFDRFEETEAHKERRERFLAVARMALRQVANETPICVDLGCGPGAITLELAALGFDVVGVDSSAAMIVIATNAAAASSASGSRCTFIHADVEDFLDTYTGSADLIISSSVFEYLKDPVAVLRLIRSRLRNGGLLAVSVPNRRSFYRRVEPLLGIVKPSAVRYAHEWRNAMDGDELIQAGEELGLTLVERSYFGQTAIKGHPVLARLTNVSVVGTLTLVVLRNN